MAERYYSDEEAQEILRVAARKSGGVDGLNQTRLLEAAAELGISKEDVLAAEQQVIENRQIEVDRIAYRKHLRRGVLGEVSSWLSTSVMLIGIELFTSGFQFEELLHGWSRWPVGIWGLVVLKNLIEKTYQLRTADETDFLKWREKQRRKLERSNGKSRDEDLDEVVREAILDHPGEKIAAIKVVREKTGLGLADAKNVVDRELEARG